MMTDQKYFTRTLGGPLDTFLYWLVQIKAILKAKQGRQVMQADGAASYHRGIRQKQAWKGSIDRVILSMQGM